MQHHDHDNPGGFDATLDLFDDIERRFQITHEEKKNEKKHEEEKKLQALHIGCGTGTSALWIAQDRGWNVVGIDVNPKAISIAQSEAEKRNLKSHVEFVCFPLLQEEEEGSTTIQSLVSPHALLFDVVFGQDPDAFFATEHRRRMFHQVFLVLKEGGIFTFSHSWIPGFGWGKSDLDAVAFKDGIKGVNADAYLEDLKLVGFEIAVADPISKLAETTLRGRCARNRMRAKSEGPQVLDAWLESRVLDLDHGFEFGARFVAVKPAFIIS